MADEPRLITDEDVRAAVAEYEASGFPDADRDVSDPCMRAALEAVAPGLRARWVAEALDELADSCHPGNNDGHAGVLGIAALRGYAAEYRAGER